MSNIEKPFANVVWNKAMPELDEIIKIDMFGDGNYQRFRILKINGMTATLFSLDNSIYSIPFNDQNTTALFEDGTQHLDYENSVLDKYLNETYYNSLKASIKAAIIPVNIIQSCYIRDNDVSQSATFNLDSISVGDYSYNRLTQKVIGNRYCWALDLDDLREYFKLDIGDTLDGRDLMEFFTEQRSAYYLFSMYFRTAYYNSNGVVFLSGDNGVITQTIPNYTHTNIITRPAFKIDLTNVDYIIE